MKLHNDIAYTVLQNPSDMVPYSSDDYCKTYDNVSKDQVPYCSDDYCKTYDNVSKDQKLRFSKCQRIITFQNFKVAVSPCLVAILTCLIAILTCLVDV
jgi:hypothetical protein